MQQQPSLSIAVDRPFEECCPYDPRALPIDKTNLEHPKLMGIGVHKAGTTYLFNLIALSRHFVEPLNGEKELFTMGQWPLEPRSWLTYLEKWNVTAREHANKRRALFEITATYLHLPGAACRVARAFPDMKFVVVLRDPVDRALSHYNMWIHYYRQVA